MRGGALPKFSTAVATRVLLASGVRAAFMEAGLHQGTQLNKAR
jgi:hypothetical protein